MRGALAAAVAAALALVLVAGCAAGNDKSVSLPVTTSAATSSPAAIESTSAPEPAPVATGSTPSATAAGTPEPIDVNPDFPLTTADQFAKPSHRPNLVFTAVRVSAHEDFDRVVLEFAGTGRPGWAVNYVDRPRLDGSGDDVSLDGNSVLDIYASGGTSPPASGYYQGPRRFQPEDGGNVVDVYVGGTFEGDTQVLAGIDGDRAPVMIFTLSGPPRLVVDVAEDGSG